MRKLNIKWRCESRVDTLSEEKINTLSKADACTNVAEGWTSSNLYNSAVYFVLFLVLAVIGEYVRMIIQNQKNTPMYEIVDEKSSVALFSNKKNIDKE